MSVPLKKSVLGIGVSVTSYGEVLRVCAQWIEERRAAGGSQLPARYAAILNVHSVMTGVLDSSFRAVLNGADLGTSDGMPLVWALRWLGARGQRRVYGPDLMLALCGQAARLGHRIFLYGGREETLAQLGELLRTRFPNLSIAGAYAPPFRRLTPEEDAACMARICASGADLAFVGIGAPKQERWMAEHKAKMPGVVMLGVGAAFDFHCGRVRQAPGWMQRAGLEWLFRLYMEPGRLWRRYVLLNPLFVILWSLQMTGILRYDLISKEQNT
jgi:N-acetylglucosaminyldiphosphoundecaprenol N-acetyl-beta-D-mannosaminyltransferase